MAHFLFVILNLILQTGHDNMESLIIISGLQFRLELPVCESCLGENLLEFIGDILVFDFSHFNII